MCSKKNKIDYDNLTLKIEELLTTGKEMPSIKACELVAKKFHLTDAQTRTLFRKYEKRVIAS
jgi:hypothetical protein